MRRSGMIFTLSVLGTIMVALVAGSPGDRASATARATASYEDFLPAWSPDGQYIAFKRQTCEQCAEGGDLTDSVRLVAVKSGQQRRLVAGGSSASWSPDGTRLAIYRYIPGDVFTIKFNGTGRKRLTADGSHPVWSPDGRNILFERFGPEITEEAWLYVVPAAGGKARRVARPGSDGDWSPDGTKIAYETGSLMLGSISRIGVVNSDGTGSILLGLGENPSWSSDGREIAYEVGDHAEPASVHVMWSDGSHERALAVGESPEFSPDGKQIAFVRGTSLWIMNKNRSNPRRLTRPPAGGRDFNQAWSPDGRSLAFQRDRSSRGSMRIWLVTRDGTSQRQLTH